MELDSRSINYHLAQYAQPKETTKDFTLFVAEKLQASKNVIDLGCGAGAATNYFAKKISFDEFLWN